MKKNNAEIPSFFVPGYVPDIQIEFPKKKDLCYTEDEFITLLRHSLSLDPSTKLRVIDQLPTLGAWQINALCEVLTEEHNEFVKLYATESVHIDSLVEIRDKQWVQVKKTLADRANQREGVTLSKDRDGLLTPVTIKQMIDNHVIGQEHVTSDVAGVLYRQKLALFNSKRQKKKKADLPPSRPLMLIGPTGTGKTMIISKGCELAEIPFVHVDASSMVQEGIVGFSTNDLAKELLASADNDVARAEYSAVFFDEIDKLIVTHNGPAVQAQLLRLIEGTELRISQDRWNDRGSKPPVRTLRTHNMLFFLGGAFQDQFDKQKKIKTIGFTSGETQPQTNLLGAQILSDGGFPREFIGRMGSILILQDLDAKHYFTMLKQSKSSPLLDKIKEIEYHGHSVKISDDALESIALSAVSRKIGARGLHQILGEIFKEAIFDAPNRVRRKYFFDKAAVEQKLRVK